jgi:hypothetical protein
MKTIIKLIVTVVFVVNMAWANVGGGHFLILGTAKANAMANATLAQKHGIESIYWNPAGITSVNQMTLNFNYAEMWAETKFQSLAFGMPALGGVAGISIAAFTTGDMEYTTIEDPDGTGEFFEAIDIAVGLTYARNITEQFSAGVSLKYIDMSIANVSAGGITMDVSGTFNTRRWSNLRIGFGVANFGPDFRYAGDDLEYTTRVDVGNLDQREDVTATYTSETFPLPLTFRVGVALDPLSIEDHRLTVELDALTAVYLSEPQYAVGAEYALMNMFMLRAGYTEHLNKGFSLGAGVRSDKSDNASFELNYSFETHEYLDALHKFSLTLGF